jgi:hypothetical protein
VTHPARRSPRRLLDRCRRRMGRMPMRRYMARMAMPRYTGRMVMPRYMVCLWSTLGDSVMPKMAASPARGRRENRQIAATGGSVETSTAAALNMPVNMERF